MARIQPTAQLFRVAQQKTLEATRQVTARAKVRHYKPAEIVGVIQQGDSQVILSPTGLGDFGVPPAGGFVVVAGSPRRIIAPNPIHMGGVLVRIEIQVRG